MLQPDMKKYLQVLAASLLGLLLGLAIAVISFIPGWVQPEGIPAGAIWGAIVLATIAITLPVGLVVTVAALFLNEQNRRRLIVIETVFITALMLVIFALLLVS
jgi:hypothetical protein